MGQFQKSCCAHESTPRRQSIVDAEPIAQKALLISAAWIYREEHSARLEDCEDPHENLGQISRRNVKKRGTRKYSVEVFVGKVQLAQILTPYLAAGRRPRHRDESRRSIDADCSMSELSEVTEIAAWSASEVEKIEWSTAIELLKEDLVVCVQIAIGGFRGIGVGHSIVCSDRQLGGALQLIFHRFQEVRTSVRVPFENRLSLSRVGPTFFKRSAPCLWLTPEASRC